MKYYTIPVAIGDLIEKLLDTALPNRKLPNTDLSTIQCRVCGKTGGHEPPCFIPELIEFWES